MRAARFVRFKGQNLTMSKALATTKIAASLVVLGAVVAVVAFAYAVQPAEAQTPGVTFTRNHMMGQSGGEIMQIQKFLNSMSDTMVSAAGAGAPGNETSYFGGKTKAAVIKFQEKYAADILTPVGLTKGTGYWGPSTRAKANALNAGTTPPGTTPPPAGSANVSVAAASQPSNSLAPQSSARVPFTTFTLKNNSASAVTVNGITIERAGLGQDAVFSGIVLVDSNNVQVGTSKTLNSNHQAVVGDTFTLQPGEQKTLTVAGNMAASLTAYAGQVVSLNVVGVNTSATVSGVLPITGAAHTVNATLSIGSVSTTTSAFDPGAAQTKNIGDTKVRFSGIRFSAGSTEDLRLYSIRWRQVGTAASSDISNVMTNVNATDYPTTVSSDGKYYTAVFPGGILIPKGNSIDVYVWGDLTGTNSASRTVDFDIDKVTDVYFVGQLYGYGIAPSGTYTPWFNAYVTTVNAGTATSISKANEVAAQNIAINVSNQPIGGFATDFKGEPVSVASMVFTVATTTASTGLLTSVSIVDSNGAIVAGPVDATWTSGNLPSMTLTFSDTVTFPVGRKVYTLKGKIPSGATNGATVAVSTTPSSNWTTVTGTISGNTVSLSGNGAFTMNTMTVKAGDLKVAVSASPAAQNIVAGAQGVEFANYQFDASQSGEDVRFSSVVLDSDLGNDATAGAVSKLSSCQLYDGATALNGGSNIVNPSTTATTTAGVDHTFTLDNPLVVSKGTIKTLKLKCNVASSADSSSVFQWGISSTNAAAITVTGVTSGGSITPASASGSDYNGQKMTIGTGSLTASTDASSPSYAIAAAGATGVNMGTWKFRSTNEAVNLTRIGLQLTNTASSSASDLTQVTLWANGVQIGTATFVGAQTQATSTLASPLSLPKDQDVIVTIKGDLAAQGTSQPGTPGHLVAIDFLGNTNTQGTGQQSGSTVNATGSTAVSGVRVFKSYPTFAKDTLPSNTLNNGEQKLLRFKVTANAAGDVGIARFSLTLATTTVTLSGLDIFAFTDAAYSTPVTGLTSDGGMENTDINLGTMWASSATVFDVDATNSSGASTTIQIPMGQTRYFEVRATVSGTASGAAVTTSLQGDSAYPAFFTSTVFMATSSMIDADANDDFIWSPNSTTTVTTDGVDWTNGYGVVGLPSGGFSDVLSK